MSAYVKRAEYRRLMGKPCKGLTRMERFTLWSCAEFMRADGYLSVPQETLAEAIGIDWRQLARVRKSAVATGWLVKISSGVYGRTAVYQASKPVVSDSHVHVSDDTLADDDDDLAACHRAGGYEDVTSDSPSSKTFHERNRSLCVPATAKRFRRSHLSYAARCANQRTLTRAAPPPKRGRPNPTPAAHRRRPWSGPAPVLADLDLCSARIATTEEHTHDRVREHGSCSRDDDRPAPSVGRGEPGRSPASVGWSDGSRRVGVVASGREPNSAGAGHSFCGGPRRGSDELPAGVLVCQAVLTVAAEVRAALTPQETA